MPSRWDSVKVNGEEMRCYVSVPEGNGPFPAVVVIQHAGGVDEFVRGMSDRFAEARFLAVAPDLYHREDPGNSDDPLTRMSRLRDVTIVAGRERGDRPREEHLRSTVRQHRHHRLLHGWPRNVPDGSDRTPDLKAAVVCWGGNIMVPWGEGPAPFELSEEHRLPGAGTLRRG